jgi:hypothetical protein
MITLKWQCVNGIYQTYYQGINISIKRKGIFSVHGMYKQDLRCCINYINEYWREKLFKL